MRKCVNVAKIKNLKKPYIIYKQEKINVFVNHAMQIKIIYLVIFKFSLAMYEENSCQIKQTFV